MAELVVVVSVIMVITGIGVPSFIQAYRSYQLNDAAGRMAIILKSTRSEAIRRNTTVNFRTLLVGNAIQAWADSNNDQTWNLPVGATPGETGILFNSTVTLVPPLGANPVPNQGAVAAGVGPGTVLVPIPTSGGTVTFDARGAVNPASVYVSYLANTADPNPGYRAVIVLPSGSVEVWSADQNGTWHESD
jgi:Tfp pilus assembly protein FimT